MSLQRLIRAMEKFENPNYPLLGPNLKALYLVGLWQTGTKFRNSLYNVIHVTSCIFVFTQFVDFYQTREDLMEALFNLSITGLSLIAVVKTLFCVAMQSKWKRMVHIISMEEISQIEKGESHTIKGMAQYKRYARTITYTYWLLVMVTIIVTLLSPALKYLSASTYREEIRNGTKSYPHILSSWFPFDKNAMPGYVIALMIHAHMTCLGAAIVGSYDANAVTIMTFMKGQIIILKEKCRRIFGENKPISKGEIFNRFKECHRHHNFIKEVYALMDSVLSPVMFIYFLVCSITICCGVVQLNSEHITTSQKLWVIEFVIAQISQLFIFCWHSNEVALESIELNQGIFESKYWRSDTKEKKLLLLLSSQLDESLVLHAGPFTNLSIPTFTQIMKGAYSFYTLFTQIQET